MLSFNQRIIRILLGGIIITATVILFVVWSAATNLVKTQTDESLEIASTVLNETLIERQNQLITSANVLTADFGFIQALATQDPTTLQSALTNHAGRIGADILFTIDSTFTMTCSVSPCFDYNGMLRDQSFIENIYSTGGTQVYRFLDGQLYQLIMLPVKKAGVTQIAGVGFKLNDTFLRRLSQVVHSEIMIVLGSNRQPEAVVASSLTQRKTMAVLQGNQSLHWIDVILQKSSGYMVRAALTGGSLPVGINVYIAHDVRPVLDQFLDLQLDVLLMALSGIALALAVGMYQARKLSEPVDQLLAAAHNIAQGDYTQTVTIDDNVSELTHFADTFEQMQVQIRERECKIRYQAEHDTVTGMFNRARAEILVNEKLKKNQTFQLLSMKVVGFRTINDLYGYANGDFSIKTLATRLSRWPGTCARISGAEVLYMPDEPLEDMQLETLKYILEQPIERSTLIIPVKIQIAEIWCPQNIDDAEDVFRKLNIIFDEAYRSDRWLVRYENALEQQYLRRLSIITELKQSLAADGDGLSMVYQPKLALKTMQVVSMEALIRWNNARLGFVPPDEFIGIAEKAGLIDQVSQWVIRRTIKDLAGFRQAGYTFTVAINLSSQDVQNEVLLNMMECTLIEYGLTPADLALEITESDLLTDAKQACETLSKLKQAGHNLAIDDFGTGYSSLAYLKNLPVDTLKIDKSFVLNLSTDSDDQRIVHTVLSLATNFDLMVIAEGVEDERTLNILQEWGCAMAQGYYISKPQSVKDILLWLNSTPYRQRSAEKFHATQ